MYTLPTPPSLNLQNPLGSVPTPSLPSIPPLPSVPKLPLKRVSGLDYKKTFTETSTYKNLKTNLLFLLLFYLFDSLSPDWIGFSYPCSLGLLAFWNGSNK